MQGFMQLWHDKNSSNLFVKLFKFQYIFCHFFMVQYTQQENKDLKQKVFFSNNKRKEVSDP